MNAIWTTLLAFSIVMTLFCGPEKTLGAAMDGATVAVSTSVSLLAVYCFWNGVFGILEKSGAVERLAKFFRPVARVLFGEMSDKANGYVCANMSANLLGVSGAATPSAILAMAETEKGDKLSRAGALFFIVNASGVQLFPTTVVGMRTVAGSLAPSDVVLPTVLTTFVTAAVGLFLGNLAFPRHRK